MKARERREEKHYHTNEAGLGCKLIYLQPKERSMLLKETNDQLHTNIYSSRALPQLKESLNILLYHLKETTTSGITNPVYQPYTYGKQTLFVFIGAT